MLRGATARCDRSENTETNVLFLSSGAKHPDGEKIASTLTRGRDYCLFYRYIAIYS